MLSFRSLFLVAIATVVLFTSSSSADQTSSLSPIEPRKSNFRFPTGKVQGVNLGGWFVLEPWITPSIFEEWAQSEEVVDEHSFCKVLGPTEAKKRLEKHWSTWITQDDIKEIASMGLNFVRIPIGYWSVINLPRDPYVKGAYKYLGQAVDWAHAAGLKVVIDLHGVPRSQNGFDNSGRRGFVHWQRKGSVKVTRRVLDKIRNDYAAHPAVASIELVNEPMGYKLNMNRVKNFYRKMNRHMEGHGVATMFHDAFEGVNSWNNFGNKLKHWVLDTHHYEVFDSSDLAMNTDGHVGTACSFGGQMSTNNKVTIAGEWTGAMTDCAKWLNGLGFGARYDGTYTKGDETSYYIGSCQGLSKGTVKSLSASYKTSMRQFIEAQMDAFELAGGWIFWAWKTESAPEWNFRELAHHGIVPQPLSARKYPGQCSG